MKYNIRALLGPLCLSAACSAHAYMIDDARNGATTYWGSNAHGYGDVIAAPGNLAFDIHGADLYRTSTQLRVDIHTNFAGHAGEYRWAAPNGIGYGDLFLASSWNPYGSDAHLASDRASNGTVWSYGLSLDNRWSNSGGAFNIFKMNGPGNIGNVLLAENFIAGGVYRNGQEVAVNNGSEDVALIGSGIWSVAPGEISFIFNLAGTDIGSWSGIALHWGPTCQNDVIEGEHHIAEPGSAVLLAIALMGFAYMRRRPALANGRPARN